MKIRMLETRRGSEDGFTVRRFHAGLIYPVAHTLGCYFLQQRWAERVEGDVL